MPQRRCVHPSVRFGLGRVRTDAVFQPAEHGEHHHAHQGRAEGQQVVAQARGDADGGGHQQRARGGEATHLLVAARAQDRAGTDEADRGDHRLDQPGGIDAQQVAVLLLGEVLGDHVAKAHDQRRGARDQHVRAQAGGMAAELALDAEHAARRHRSRNAHQDPELTVVQGLHRGFLGDRRSMTAQRGSAGREAAPAPAVRSSAVTAWTAAACLQSGESSAESVMRLFPALLPLLLALPTLALAQAATSDAPAARASPAPAPPAASAADLATFKGCMARMRSAAGAKGVDGASFDRLAADLAPDMTVLPLLNQQPEFSTPIWDYLAALVDRQRVDDGLAMLARHAGVLARVQAEYGVDPATVVAVWGVESDYGRSFGKDRKSVV